MTPRPYKAAKRGGNEGFYNSAAVLPGLKGLASEQRVGFESRVRRLRLAPLGLRECE
jgi:hypothetical protein